MQKFKIKNLRKMQKIHRYNFFEVLFILSSLLKIAYYNQFLTSLHICYKLYL